MQVVRDTVEIHHTHNLQALALISSSRRPLQIILATKAAANIATASFKALERAAGKYSLTTRESSASRRASSSLRRKRERPGVSHERNAT